ncbi:MAG: hypothetical protein R3C99_01925 [Pirellulaceae bacterium]|nr:hypothetical protein [Planctomycetales bacterium]MCA9163274.1 hypothetical protein [Planctomycetales bacterium]MCA9202420.1 hypothetical protein [Planctomycetales bacterium]MCA9209569.1 hypothetical protein [Planctomycetales bacterium]MCA9219387.1 hypothetical protein [Planctomycetales bacterium]
MSEEYSIQDLAADELAELLGEHGISVSMEQALTLKQLLVDAGGVDNAVDVVETLASLARAA